MLEAVAVYTVIEFVAAFGIESYLVGPLAVAVPTVAICVAAGLIGVALGKLTSGPVADPVERLLPEDR